MRTTRKRLRTAVHTLCALALALAPLAARRARAQNPNPQRPPAIDTYAITNARIVPVSGAEVARGTVVIREGLIAAVGANVTAPTDARVIDGAGLTVYPGLIDAHSTLGLPAGAGAQGGGRGGGVAVVTTPQSAPAIAALNSTQPVGLQPEVRADEFLRPGGDQIENERSAGITAALTAPREGVFAGQSAFINLAGDTPQQMIVRSPVALHVGFTPLRTGGYPGSLLGVFSAFRQMMLDAQRYREVNAIYERSPRGMRRPDQDRSLAALQPALAREMPVVFTADSQREIERALDLAEEFKLRAMISGGLEAWKVADRLAAAKVPVLLSLNFPRRTTAPSPDADPDPIRVLRQRVDAPKNAGRLAAAGVRFAFQSGGLTNLSDFLANAARAVEGGLARDEALRAMTIRPAELFGVENQLGTIEAGKIANLTVVRGDIFARDRRITHVFIDGRPVDLRPAPAAAGGASGAGISGPWSLRVTLQGQPEKAVTLTLRQEGERLSGGLQGDLGTSQIANASVSPAGELKFTAPVTTGGQTTEATFTGTVTGTEMRGTVTTVGGGNGSFTGTRPEGFTPPAGGGRRPPGAGGEGAAAATGADLSGTWTLAINLEGQNVPATLTLRQAENRLSGTLQSPLGSAEVANGSAGADGFRFTVVVPIQGQSTEVTFTGTANGNTMSGSATTSQGAATFTGTRPGSNS
ncbi:MAG TPA: amidohydrolase family protein [Pyrinomonadaceae bacterium]|jgi:imidazolonepropionase-like amidohydrolase|nr:amidohydrolase family protein [Pyrinomonadaceae bacterium]